jgi:hypothetical protein
VTFAGFMTTGPACECEDECLVGEDSFAIDGPLNPKWTDVIGDPVQSGGVVTIESDDDEYMVWEDDAKLLEGVTGISIDITFKFNKAPDHPTIADAYGQGHGFDIVWDWRGENEFMTAKIVFAGGVANPRVYLRLQNLIDESGQFGELALDPDLLPDDLTTAKICIYEDFGYGYGYGYGYGESQGWKLYARIGNREKLFDIPEPLNLRSGFGSALNVIAPGTANNPYQIYDWRLGKISEACSCLPPQPCEAKVETFDPPDSSTIEDWEEEVGDWETVSGRLIPPSTGKLNFTGNTPSVLLEGVRLKTDFNFGGAAGTVRIKIQAGDNEYVALEVISVAATDGTAQLIDQAGDIETVEDVSFFNWSNVITLSICQKENQLVGVVSSGSTKYVAHIPNNWTGIALETIGVGSGAWFDNLEITRLLPNCPPCTPAQECTACEDNIAPGSLEIGLQGLTGAFARLNGIWILPYKGCGVAGHITYATGVSVDGCQNGIASPFRWFHECRWRVGDQSMSEMPAANYGRNLTYELGGGGFNVPQPEEWPGLVCVYDEVTYMEGGNSVTDAYFITLAGIRAAIIANDIFHAPSENQPRRLMVRLTFNTMRKRRNSGVAASCFAQGGVTVVEYFKELGDIDALPEIKCLKIDSDVPFYCWESAIQQPPNGGPIILTDIEDAIGFCTGWASLQTAEVTMGAGL